MQLIIKKMTKKFKNKTVLQSFSLKLNEGVYGLLGPNGAGKTTLFRCITGLYEISQGVIGMIDEVDGVVRLRQEDIGYLPQKFGIFKNMCVRDMLSYFASMKNIQKEEIEHEVVRCLKLVHLEERANDKIRMLSGGMIRRLGIAQALLGNPKLLLFDEPTTGLDPEERIRFRRIISEIAQGRIIIISTHIVEDIDAICNEVVIMNHGQVMYNGSKKNMIAGMNWHVYEMKEDRISQISGEYHELKIFSQDGEIYQRILLKEQLDVPECKPTLEDAYYEYIYR